MVKLYAVALLEIARRGEEKGVELRLTVSWFGIWLGGEESCPEGEEGMLMREAEDEMATEGGRATYGYYWGRA